MIYIKDVSINKKVCAIIYSFGTVSIFIVVIATMFFGRADERLSVICSAFVSILAVASIAAVAATDAIITRPMRRIAWIMSEIAEGRQPDADIDTKRKDDLGTMGRAIVIFQRDGVKLREAEIEAAARLHASDLDRASIEAATSEIRRKQDVMVAAIGTGLDHLAKGDLTGRLSQAFPAEYEKLRADFNATAKTLQEALSTISLATSGISTGSDEIAHASDELSRRTEQQAASLEETAAALNTLTGTVRTMAADAGTAANVVLTTRAAAEASGATVEQAVEARPTR